jgi:hypothetical protein
MWEAAESNRNAQRLKSFGARSSQPASSSSTRTVVAQGSGCESGNIERTSEFCGRAGTAGVWRGKGIAKRSQFTDELLLALRPQARSHQ